jgi:hypothetical protein
MSGEGREEGKRRFKVPSCCHCLHKLQSFPLNVLILVNSTLWKNKNLVWVSLSFWTLPLQSLIKVLKKNGKKTKNMFKKEKRKTQTFLYMAKTFSYTYFPHLIDNVFAPKKWRLNLKLY